MDCSDFELLPTIHFIFFDYTPTQCFPQSFLTLIQIVETEATNYLPCLKDSEETIFTNSNQSLKMVYEIRASQNDCGLLKVNKQFLFSQSYIQVAYWTNGILFKVVPCILLTLSIVALLKIIADVANRRRNLAQVSRSYILFLVFPS